MAKHEFGIMEADPAANKRYESYEPEKYSCISLDDACLEPLLRELEEINTFWHTTSVPKKGLAYCGITLIPPDSAPQFMRILHPHTAEVYRPLYTLFKTAWERKKYVIHFGI